MGQTGKTESSCTAYWHEWRLSPEQEEFLSKWILEEKEKDCAPLHIKVCDMGT